MVTIIFFQQLEWSQLWWVCLFYLGIWSLGWSRMCMSCYGNSHLITLGKIRFKNFTLTHMVTNMMATYRVATHLQPGNKNYESIWSDAIIISKKESSCNLWLGLAYGWYYGIEFTEYIWKINMIVTIQSDYTCAPVVVASGKRIIIE